MKTKISILFLLFVFSACARLPVQVTPEQDKTEVSTHSLTDESSAIPELEDGSLDPIQLRIQRVENRLIPLNAEGDVDLGKAMTLNKRMQHYGIPGVSIAVINDYQLEWAKGYGVLEAGSDERVTADSLFNAGSTAKPLTAAAALMMVEQGLLNLDQDINEKLVSWQVPENEYTVNEKVTLRRLLSHSAGLSDGFAMRSSSDPEFDWWMASEGETPTITILQLLEAQSPADEGIPTRVTRLPGAVYEYSNFGYGVIQMLMTAVTQKPFADLVQEVLLGPVGMTSSTFKQPLPEALRVRATSEHYVNGQPFTGKRHHYPIQAAGGLWTTPSDLARFAIEIMHARDGESDLLLSQEMAGEMLAPQIEVQDSGVSDSYGLGFNLGGEGENFLIMHTGGTWGSTCLLWMYPETGQGAVIMTNSAGGEGAIRFEILLGIASEYGWPLLANLMIFNRLWPVWGIVTLLSLAVIIWRLVQKQTMPWSKKLVWILIVALLGPFGLLVYWLFDRNHRVPRPRTV